VKTTRFRAAWVLPIVSPPLRDGWVVVRDGVVVDIGTGTGAGTGVPRASIADGERIEEVDLGRVAILPGLVNAHTHLELSWLWGKVPAAASLPAWVSTLMAARAAAGKDDPSAIASAVASLEEHGTAAVGDISNTLASIGALAHGRVDAVVFRELIGFSDANDPEAMVAKARADLNAAIAATPPLHGARIRGALAPHAPYSVSPGLFAAIHRATAAIATTAATASTVATGMRRLDEMSAEAGLAAASTSTPAPATVPSSVHLGESLDELRFLRDGDGPWRDVLQRVGAWNPAWTVPRAKPVEYLEALGVLAAHLLVVHGVHLDDDELRTLARHGATLVTCPRSNVWVGSGPPPIERFYASGVRVAIGTDSLASATDLNLFSELATLHHLAPQIPAARLLASATHEGARALGFTDLGTIAPGARARLITIDLPLTLDDVETYLVEGIDPSQIAWVPDSHTRRHLP
jgi:cytosine/adenosine deaminase-related metal-dependent hydrolase